ncbi:MAG: hypothetical protein JKX81_00525, partial [Arenicella sp.]|nr:hypothetical protein [Arenicella sp.]
MQCLRLRRAYLDNAALLFFASAWSTNGIDGIKKKLHFYQERMQVTIWASCMSCLAARNYKPHLLKGHAMFKNLMLFGLSLLLLSACADGDTSIADTLASKPSDAPLDVIEGASPESQVPLSESSMPLAKASEQMIDAGRDYHSLSNPEQVRVKHIALDLTVDFDQKVIRGTAALDYHKVDSAAKILILDSRDLSINKVTSDGQALAFTLRSDDSFLGSALAITLPANNARIVIDYSTSPQASGVQWLTPAQTAGGKQPFLFTQAQAIHARSFIPLQDSPQVRVTYEAIIRTPKELLAVMSASNDPKT